MQINQMLKDKYLEIMGFVRNKCEKTLPSNGY